MSGITETTEMKACPNCAGTGKEMKPTECTTCLGRKTLRCIKCNGSGKSLYLFSCSVCAGKGLVNCGVCEGSGIVNSHVDCERCRGIGKIPLVSASAPNTRAKWIAGGTLVTIITLILSFVSGTKDGLDLFTEYIFGANTESTDSPLLPLNSNSVSLDNIIIGSSQDYYKIKIDVSNGYASDVVIQNIRFTNTLSKYIGPNPTSLCTGDFAYEVLSDGLITGYDDEALKFTTGVEFESSEFNGYLFRMKGSYKGSCYGHLLDFDFDTSYVLPNGTTSSIYLAIPKSIELTGGYPNSGDGYVSISFLNDYYDSNVYEKAETAIMLKTSTGDVLEGAINLLQ